MSKKKVRFVQIMSAPWEGEYGKPTYTLYALGDDGAVYRRDGRDGPWIKLE